jgi:hypothetical protein
MDDLERTTAPWLQPPISWTCHICGQERPDDKILVYTTDLSAEFGLQYGTLRQNVRYCEDNPACILGAQTKRLINAKH